MEPKSLDMESKEPRGECCPVCEKACVTVRKVMDTFLYGEGQDAKELTVEIPVHECSACGFRYFDEAAEKIRHAAVCRHLGILSPDEIRRIRKTNALSQSAFAAITGLGEATLARWESGILFQNRANDKYLRILMNAENIRMLKAISREPETASGFLAPWSVQFRSLVVTDELIKRKESFSLRRKAS